MTSAGPPPPSPADTMRHRLAKAHLQEARGLNLAESPVATLISTIRRLTNALEDEIEIAEKYWSAPE